MRHRVSLAAIAFCLVVCVSLRSGAADRARLALNMNLPTLNFSGVAFGDTIDFLRDVSGTNIHVDWKALETAGVGKDAVVNVRLRSVSMRKALNLVLNEAG